MKAIVVSELGGPEKLALQEIPDPEPGPGEVLVDVAAAGVNFIDVYHRIGLYDLGLPFTPGLEGAGTVAGVGTGVEELAVGDRIGWTNVLGSYADKHVVPVEKAVPIPDGLDTATVAAVLLQGITAHYLATDTFTLRRGHRCLIHAGAGGVGLLLTQVAKLKGAEVFTTVGSAEKAELSRAAGSDHVIDYSQAEFGDAIEAIAGPRSFDVVYDGVGASTFSRSLDMLRPRGLMVSYGNASGPVAEISPLILSQKGSLYLTRPTMAHYIPTREALLARCGELFDWIGSGDLRVRVGAEFSLSDAAEAHRDLQARRTTGKVLLRP